jgi:hypothetical protein
LDRSTEAGTILTITLPLKEVMPKRKASTMESPKRERERNRESA